MQISVLQHVPHEGPGAIANWAREREHTVHITHLYRDDPLPAVQEIDMLMVLGGPMGVYDEAKHSWLSAEKIFIRAAIDANKYVLGICLGAQLIAHVLGAKVHSNAVSEIGWFPIGWTDEARAHPLLKNFSEVMTVFHWHNDQFDIPTGALKLGASEACPHQGFLWRDHVLGLQFHLEVTHQDVELYFSDGETLPVKTWVQTQTQILSLTHHTASTHFYLKKLLDNWLALRQK